MLRARIADCKRLRKRVATVTTGREEINAALTWAKIIPLAFRPSMVKASPELELALDSLAGSGKKLLAGPGR